MFRKIIVLIVVLYQVFTYTEGKGGSADVSKVRFLFYPSAENVNYYQELFYNNTLSIRGSLFRPLITTTFFIHGFAADYQTFQDAKNAYLRNNVKANVILVDWSPLATPGKMDNILAIPQVLFGYFNVVQNVDDVGYRVGDMILFLKNYGVLRIEDTHLVGHSLGSHVSGDAGKRIVKLLNNSTRIPRVSALDPAGPLFQPATFAANIGSIDAVIVDAYHSDARSAGDARRDGDVDFWPNGGNRQPGCPPVITNLACNHLYAIKMYTAAITQPFVACACKGINILDSFKDQLNKCLHPCQEPTYIGPFLNDKVRGNYYVQTPSFAHM